MSNKQLDEQHQRIINQRQQELKAFQQFWERMRDNTIAFNSTAVVGLLGLSAGTKWFEGHRDTLMTMLIICVISMSCVFTSLICGRRSRFSKILTSLGASLGMALMAISFGHIYMPGEQVATFFTAGALVFPILFTLGYFLGRGYDMMRCGQPFAADRDD